jgi:hypothetical protein
MCSNEYPLGGRGRGRTEQNRLRYNAYEELIVRALRAKPWSNVTEIVRESSRILREEPLRQDVAVQKPTRKTVLKHLRQMEGDPTIGRESKVWKIRHRYILMEDVVGKSYELHRLVSRVLGRGELEDVNYSFVHNTAGCYLATQPTHPHDFVVAGSLHLLGAIRFAKELFWLEDLVAFAIEYRHLSRRVLSRKKINFARLSRGLKDSFGDTEVIMLAFAVKLPELLNFLKTPSGQALASRILEEKREDILRKARKGPFSKEELGLLQSYSWQQHD